MRGVALIGAASGWGAGFRATEEGPESLRAFGLAERLQDVGISARWAAMVETDHRWRGGAARTTQEVFDLVARHARALSSAVEQSLMRREFPLVVGGDHAAAIGTWGGVARATGGAPLGLIWVDAHLDAHTPATTLSMNPHGMGTAVLLGEGSPQLLSIGGNAIQSENLCFIGIRSYEVGEWATLRRRGVKIFYMDEVEERGFAAVFRDAVAIASRGTSGFGLSIDLDGFDPQDVPGVGLKVRGGLRGRDVAAALRGIGAHPGLRALEIVEYIPELDVGRRTAHLVFDLAASCLAPVTALATA